MSIHATHPTYSASEWKFGRFAQSQIRRTAYVSRASDGFPRVLLLSAQCAAAGKRFYCPDSKIRSDLILESFSRWLTSVPVSRCQRAIRLFQPSFGQGTSHPKESERIIPLSAETRQLSGNGHPYPKMVMSNGSAKKRGRPGGQPKKKSEQRHPIDAGDDLERVRQPMRMEGASPCGWKSPLYKSPAK